MRNILKTNIYGSSQEIEFYDDDIIGKKLKSTGSWEPLTSNFLYFLSLAIKNKDSVCIDIGAHIGYFSALLKLNFGNRVMSFEPNPHNYVLLKNNLSKFDNCQVFNCGISDKNATIPFYYCEEETGGGSFDITATSPDYKQTEIRVEVKTLSSFNINFDKVSIIKIDAQSYEEKILDNICEKLNNGCIVIVERFPVDIEVAHRNNLIPIAMCDNNLVFIKVV